jgi:clan AA aspartic protease
MGTFSTSIEVGDSEGRRFLQLEAMVDTGATYLVVPRDILEDLGCRPVGRRRFALGDDRVVEYEVGEILLRLNEEVLHTHCVFGDAGSQTLLGAVPLETFMLAVDPVNQKPIPVVGMLK